MRVMIAPDKFRGSLTAIEAAEAMAAGVRRVAHDAEIDLAPLADGGEGTVEALVSATRGCFLEEEVDDPLGRPVPARFGMLGDGTTAVIEMAAASGHRHLAPDERDPTRTTTRGTGQLLLRAIEAGAERIVVGIGGSATNDGGAGLAEALGFRLLDREGNPLPPGGGPLIHLDRIDASGRDPRLDSVSIQVACDVTNPLCGPEGASPVYGPQKGATPEMVDHLDAALARFAEVVRDGLGRDVAEVPGSGAAGGLGAGLLAFADAELTPGIDLVLEIVKLDERLDGVDFCLTGEGKLDVQSGFGKTVAGVGRLARARGIPVIALAGTLEAGVETLDRAGLTSAFAIAPGPISLEEASARAAELLADTAERVARIVISI